MHTKTQCITLKTTPFKESSKILQVLTKDLGLISILVKGLSQKKLSLIRLCSPFTISEVILKKSSSDIYSFRDVTILEENHHLRKKLEYITIASCMTRSILSSHFHQEKALSIFHLLKVYLKNIPINPDAIYLSFLLKLLSNDDLMNLQTHCSKCKNPSNFLQDGESLCHEHGSTFGFSFSLDDFKKLFILCYAKSFSLLQNLEISSILKEKVNLLFHDLIY